MGKLSWVKRKGNYYKIYEQIYEDPVISLYDIHRNTGLSRNTVSKYLKDMYAQGMLFGPYIEMNPAPNYREYVYLMNFSNPPFVFRALKGFPHILECGIAFDDWNTMVITDLDLDFSKMVGFQSMVAKGVRGLTYTPRVEYTSWNEAFENMYDQIGKFTPAQKENRKREFHALNWGNDEWKLFHAFKHNMRKKVIATLKETKVRYETYSPWMKTLRDHCTVHTEFYPEGRETYMGHCFLFSTGHKSVVTSLFSLLPTSSVFTEVGDQLLVFAWVDSPDTTRRLFCTIYDMKTVGIIEEFSHAALLGHDSIKGVERQK